MLRIARSLSRQAAMGKKAVLLGVYDVNEDKEKFILTKNAQNIDQQLNGRLSQLISVIGPIKKGKSRVFYEPDASYSVIGVAGLGPNNAGFNEQEDLDESKENIRAALGGAIRSLRDCGPVDEVDVDDCGDAEAAAEGVHLGLYNFDELKGEGLKKSSIKINLLPSNENSASLWERGTILASGQNVARRLMDLPANWCTPRKFADEAVQLLPPHGVKVEVRDKAWAEKMKMGSFLSVSRGSEEPPYFLELHYNNKPNTKPLVMVGKGICFDSGGISLKPPTDMDKMRADMGGAANVFGTVLTLARLNAPVNVIGLIPLSENLPSGSATKPGDVVYAMNGKSIQVDNTDAEGRLILADGLCYAHQFDPQLIIDIATLTGAIGVALGCGAGGAYTAKTELFKLLQKCGSKTGERLWRMPLYNYFTKNVTDPCSADVTNTSKCPGYGGSCIAAAFLREFVTCPNWIHLDVSNIKENKDELPYYGKTFTGRPMRALTNFVEAIFAQQ